MTSVIAGEGNATANTVKSMQLLLKLQVKVLYIRSKNQLYLFKNNKKYYPVTVNLYQVILGPTWYVVILV